VNLTKGADFSTTGFIIEAPPPSNYRTKKLQRRWRKLRERTRQFAVEWLFAKAANEYCDTAGT
jgi:hypothetical protein